MFNLQNLMQMAMQAMLRRLVSSDAMYNQWCAFSKKWGIPVTSRAEFDSLVNQFNNTSPESKMSQLQNIDSGIAQKLINNMMK